MRAHSVLFITGVGGTLNTGFMVTLIVTLVVVCTELLSCAMNVTMREPVCDVVGVQENAVCAGLPLTGKAGVMVVPSGMFTALSVTLSPGSLSSALTEKFTVWPGWILYTKLFAGVRA